MYDKIVPHLGHTIEVVSYGWGQNVSVECVDCHEVIVDADRDEDSD